MDILLQIWMGTLIATAIYSVGYTVFFYYATIRIFQFLKENNPERYAYLKGKDFIGWGYEKRVTVLDRSREWLYSDMNNEIDVIRNLKNGINNYGRYGTYLFVYVFISFLLIILANTQGIL